MKQIRKSIFILPIMIVIVACNVVSPQPIITATPLLIGETATSTSDVIATPSFVISSALTAPPTPDMILNIPKNALIVYAAGREIDVIPAAGGLPIPILQNSSLTYYYSPTWSPSGDQI